MFYPTTMDKSSDQAINLFFFLFNLTLYSVSKRMPYRELSRKVFVKGTNKEMNTISVFLAVYDFVMS